jgi:CubicO group peptidase (beta-lactamase class C family)
MSPTVQTAIDEILQRAVADGAVPCVAATASGRDGVIYQGGAGPRVPQGSASDASDDAVGVDITFRIMSMTKMVVTAAALQMAEQSKLDLDAPVEEYVPQFAELQVLEGFQDGADAREPGTPRLRPPAAKATLRQLVTHTSGLGYGFWEPAQVRFARATRTPSPLSGSMRAFEAPLLFEPGERFAYGPSTDWLGRALEAIDGRPLPEVVTERITGPLGMERTSFTLSAQARASIVPVCVRGEDGVWAPSEFELPEQPDWWAAGHGLYSTPRDYLRFQEMLLHDGQAPDGPRILAAETVAAAFADQLGGLRVPERLPTADPASAAELELGPGYTWGHGLLVNTYDEPRRRRAGTGAWAGLFNSHFWVDRAAGVTGAIYSNCLPFLEPGAAATYLAFERMVYASL